MRPGDAYQGVDETLQADVMRFMAIIAFCLIAILALVRSVEPPPRAAALQGPADPAPAPEPRPVVEAHASRAAEAAAVTPVRPTAAQAPEPGAAVAVAPVDAPPAEPRPMPDAETLALAQIEPDAQTVPDAQTLPDPQPAAPPEDAARGLSLRFASDRDFLRLVNRGDIRVFAFRDGEVLSVSADFRFEQAPAPGRLHELEPETIPDLMTAALRGATTGTTFRWGVAMPDRMARQIRGYLDSGATGELVIDRFGEVRHHDA